MVVVNTVVAGNHTEVGVDYHHHSIPDSRSPESGRSSCQPRPWLLSSGYTRSLEIQSEINDRCLDEPFSVCAKGAQYGMEAGGKEEEE